MLMSRQQCSGSCELGFSLLHIAAPSRLEACLGFDSLLEVLQTGFARPGATAQYDYALRRQALRATWFPSSQEELSRCRPGSTVCASSPGLGAGPAANDEPSAAHICIVYVFVAGCTGLKYLA